MKLKILSMMAARALPLAIVILSMTKAAQASCPSLQLQQNSGVVSSTVPVNGGFTLTCNFGSTAYPIYPSVGSGSCQFAGNVGNDFRFSCMAGGQPGAFQNACVLAGTNGELCQRASVNPLFVYTIPTTPPPLAPHLTTGGAVLSFHPAAIWFQGTGLRPGLKAVLSYDNNAQLSFAAMPVTLSDDHTWGSFQMPYEVDVFCNAALQYGQNGTACSVGVKLLDTTGGLSNTISIRLR